MSSGDEGCDSCASEPEFTPIIKERKEPVGNDDFIEPKSCGNCIHRQSCGAYWMMKKMVNELHKEFGYMIKFPMPLAMLAEGCKEFKDKRKTITPEEGDKKGSK